MSVYAMSDLHGQLELFNQMANFIGPNDTVYCLGDCGDRGPEPWKTIKAVASDSRFIYMMGNHEDMLIGAMQKSLGKRVRTRYHYAFNPRELLYMNGGARTIEEWEQETNEDQEKWLEYLKSRPLVQIYDNTKGNKIILSHAGPSRLAKYEENNVPPSVVLWDRDCCAPIPEGVDSNVILVHGHTPIPYIYESWTPKGGVLLYNDQKIDIDFGSVVTNTAVLFDLDTFDEHIFTIDPSLNFEQEEWVVSE